MKRTVYNTLAAKHTIHTIQIHRHREYIKMCKYSFYPLSSSKVANKMQKFKLRELCSMNPADFTILICIQVKLKEDHDVSTESGCQLQTKKT